MLAAPLIVTPPFLFFKRGRQQLGDRFGLWNLSLDSCLWLHGASLGEMIGLSHIARELAQRFPETPLLASATSPTGLKKASEFAVASKLLPFDHPVYFARNIDAVHPKAFIFGETELWPNLLQNLNKRNIPSYLVNGQLSESTVRNYSLFKSLIHETLHSINHIFVSSEDAQDRFLRLGADAARMSVVANTKYDVDPAVRLGNEEKLKLKKSLFQNENSIVVLSSLRPGEEKVLFPAIQNAKVLRNINFVIAPRHSEKFSYFENEMRAFKFEFEKRSLMTGAVEKNIILLDTLGEMASLLPAADLVFVGGTFADYGGHNPLEPAGCGIATVVGPFHEKVKDIVKVLREGSALFEASNVNEVANLLTKVAKTDPQIKEYGQKALETSKFFHGGSKQIVDRIAKDLSSSKIA